MLQYRFIGDTEITKTGPSFTVHNSHFIESSSIYRTKFLLNNYQSTDDITGFLANKDTNAQFGFYLALF